jgi:hypothetical protein
MATFKAVLRFVAEVILVLGAIACILVWLEIKPKDFRAMTISLPHWLWLIGSLALVAASLVSSAHGLFWRLSRNHLSTSPGMSVGDAAQLQKTDGRVSLIEVEIEVSNRADVTYKRKIRPVFVNNFQHSIGVYNLRWNPGASGVPGLILQDTLQVKRNGEWTPSPHGISEALVYPGECFRTWIAVDGEFSETDLKHRRERHLLGELTLMVERKQTTVTL